MHPLSRALAWIILLVAFAPVFGGDAPGRLETVDGLRILHLTGSPRQMGLAHGRLLRAEARRTIRWLLEEWDSDGRRNPKEATDDALASLRRHLPATYLDELRGLAEGSGIALDDLLLAHAMPLRIEGSAGVVLRSRVVGGKAMHWHALRSPHDADKKTPRPLLVVYHPSNGHAYVTVTWPGYVGAVAGMNERGISIGAQPVMTEGLDARGYPLSLRVRDALRRADNLSDAVTLFRADEATEPANVLITDGKIPDARVLERAGDQWAIFGPGDSAEDSPPHRPLIDCLRRSNHFVDARLSLLQRERDDPRGSESQRRYQAMTRFVVDTETPMGVTDCLDWLRSTDQPTAPSVVFSPSDLVFRIATDPSKTVADGAAKPVRFRRFVLASLAAGDRIGGNGPAIEAPDRQGAVDDVPLRIGRARPRERADEATIPKIYRLDSAPFRFEVEPVSLAGGVAFSKVRFPSPLETDHPENNTVHAEFFRPFGAGPFPCVLVLHITGGDFELSRFMSRALASSGTASLFVKMPYYGERRPQGKKIRMVSNDLERGLASMRQVVLDLRRACDWIEASPELDGARIGVMGVSLGAITGALATAIEPRISHSCLIMGGARLEHVLYESVEREAREYRELWTSNGGNRKSFAKVFAPFDPATYADRLRRRIVLMIGASEDQTIPKRSSLALWEATGKQRIVWYPCGHYGMAKYFLPALGHGVHFFREWPDRKDNAANPESASIEGDASSQGPNRD